MYGVEYWFGVCTSFYLKICPLLTSVAGESVSAYEPLSSSLSSLIEYLKVCETFRFKRRLELINAEGGSTLINEFFTNSIS